jgi:hypothetical protein
MPYNIFYIAFFAVVLGIVIALLTRFGRPAPPPEVLPESAYGERAQHLPEAELGEPELRRAAQNLLERYDIRVEGEDRNSEREFYLLAASDDPVIGGRYVVNCRVANADEVLPPERILEFRDFVRAQGLTRGVFITSGYFAKESRFLVEDAAVSLLSRGDVKKILEER